MCVELIYFSMFFCLFFFSSKYIINTGIFIEGVIYKARDNLNIQLLDKINIIIINGTIQISFTSVSIVWIISNKKKSLFFFSVCMRKLETQSQIRGHSSQELQQYVSSFAKQVSANFQNQIFYMNYFHHFLFRYQMQY